MTTQIRPAARADAALILRFVTELAEYEAARDQVVATVESIERSLFGAAPAARALIVEVDGEAAGFAVYCRSYSTWLGQAGLYLEDVYVAPHARGAGVGQALMRALARIAGAAGCGRFEWSVLDWNAPAIRFYEALGAAAQPEWVRYRLAGDALRAVAADGGPSVT